MRESRRPSKKNRQARNNREVRETGSDLLVRRHFRTKGQDESEGQT